MVPHCRIIETEPNGCLSKDNRHRLERVLRLRPGDKFVVTDGCGKESEAILENDGNYSIVSWYEPNREPDIDVTLFIALSKGDRLEWVIEKAVEMGVRKIVPLISEHCIVKEASDNKLERWQKIAETAMIQCGGCLLPNVEAPLKLFNISKPDSTTLPLFLYEENMNYSVSGLKDIPSDIKKIWVISGPEGGFSDSEVKFFKDSGWKTIWLGKRLFRMDTAPIVALANILSSYWL
ncbi:MAG: 16S rRNA (uracil(1498)-N(3))-methyltransferase [Candidatus Riflebacteria bacterium]|nr:16S rRNA (uracil(1498)-N(3))-methyltransferase [Candidatus Riflebacteria bacterium]